MTQAGASATRPTGTVPRGCAGRATPALDEHDVHVWQVCLDTTGEALDQLAGSLSPDERRRARAYSFAGDRRRFVARRGFLRLLLAGYVDRPPGALRFRYAPRGKPELAGPGGTAVDFSCSHSRGLAVYAFARGRRVGVDVEAVRPLPEAADIARLCFSGREQSELAALPGCLDEAVIRGWTRKEAYAKAVGDGLHRPLERVEVTLAADAPPALRAIDGAPAIAHWSLRAWSPERGFLAALVVEGPRHRVRWHVGRE